MAFLSDVHGLLSVGPVNCVETLKANDPNNAKWVGAPESFMFGSAANVANANVDDVHLYWQPLTGGSYFLWLKVNGPGQVCKIADVEQASMPHTATVSVKTSSVQPLAPAGTTVPRFSACPEPYDNGVSGCAKKLNRVSIQDVADMTAPGSAQMNEVVQAALNQRTFMPMKYLSNYYPEEDSPTGSGDSLIYLGTFNAWEVLHVDVSDVGCTSTTGIFFNIVARWGLESGNCQNTMDPDSERCAPEAFMFGTAHDNAAANIKPYWVSQGQSAFELYIGVSNYAKCGDKTEAQEHTLSASVRSSQPLSGKYSLADGTWSEYANKDKTAYTCANNIGKANPLGQCSGLTAMAVLSIEDAVKDAATMVPKSVDLVDTFVAKDGTTPATGMKVTLTDYGAINKKAFNVKYIANQDETSEKDENFAIQFPIGLVKTFQPLTITVQDVGASSGVGHQYTCLAKSKPNAGNALAEWTPECFFFGSAGKAGQDIAENFNFYFMAPANPLFPSSNDKNEHPNEYLLYLGISQFNKARTDGGLEHNLAIEVSSSSTVRWCLPGDKAWRNGGNGCDTYDETDGLNFYTKATESRILTDTTIFPTQASVDDGADRSVGGKGGMVDPFLSLEDINDVLTKKAQECYRASKKLNPDGWKCEVV
jgi:hypothetical protein